MRIALWILVIAGLWRLLYTSITGQLQGHIQQTKNITSLYTVKTQQRASTPGEDIFVYNQSWVEVFSLTSEDPQYFFQLVDTSLIVDLWTSASQRTVDIYDIPSKTKIFSSIYYPSDKKSLLVDNRTLHFLYAINTHGLNNPPANAPSCEEPYNGYVEERTFNLIHHTIDTTWVFTCAYFE